VTAHGRRDVQSLKVLLHPGVGHETAVEVFRYDYSDGGRSARRCGHLSVPLDLDDLKGLDSASVLRLLAAALARGDRLQRTNWPIAQPLPGLTDRDLALGLFAEGERIGR
jgi:hypothetical protein